MSTNGDFWRDVAERKGIPLRTLADVKEGLERDKAMGDGTDISMARLMLRHGRLTAEAREYVARQYGAFLNA